jgi:hypothetical protein
MDRSAPRSRLGVSDETARQATKRLPEGMYPTLEGWLRRCLASAIFLKIQPVFDLPFVADEYHLIGPIPDLPLIRICVLN